MAAGRIVISEFAPARDRNDALVAGAKMFVYTNGTTTLASIYTSAALTTALANPVVANSSGQFAQVWADASLLYTVSITGPNGESIGNPSVFDDYSPSTNFAVSQVEEYKAPVRVASTANITIASALINGSTIDGVVVATGDRVLLKDQSTGSQNGIYVVVASGAAMRAGDADTSAKVLSGMTMFVSEGTANGGAVFTLTTANPIVLGTTALVFSRYAGIGILPIANGGTGSATADGALTNLGGTTVGKAVFTAVDAAAARTATGTVIGTDVQAYDADLTTWAGITPGTGVGAALAINVGSAGAFTTFDGAGGTPSSMTLTNATGLPIAGLVSSTSTALGVGSLELGNASDTTLARSSAGNVTIEGNLVYRAGGTDVPITDGGTGSSTAGGALTNFGVSAFVQTLLGTATNPDFLTAFGLIAGTAVGYIGADTGSTQRTIQMARRDIMTFEDFGAVGNNSQDDTAFITAAITAAAARAATGGVQARVSGVPGKVYKITSTIALATGVDIDLNGSKVVQYTADTPVFSAPGTDIAQWSLRNGTLSYNTAQTAVQTSGIGLRLANGANSYNFQVTDLDISNACKGIVTPTTAGTFSFLGTFTNVRTIDCADWGWDIRCSSVSGANTNLTFNNCWAVQGGTPKAASKGFNIKALSQGRFNSMAVDHCALEAFTFESCTGEWGCLSVESCDFVGPVTPVTFFESPGTVQSLKYIDNTYTSTGGDIYMLRPGCNVTGYLQIDSFEESGGVFTGANTYEVNPTAGMRIVNNRASTSRSPVFADFGIRRKIIRWNGIDLMRIFGGGQVEVFTTTVPASEEWIVGDTATNTAPAAGGTPGWKCTTAGQVAPAWTISTAYSPAGTLVTNDGGKVYELVTPGTSAGSGGPTGTGASIADGTCVWKYDGVLAVFKAMANLAA